MFRRIALGAMAVLAAGSLIAADAEARVGSGRSIGSRGANTYSAPPATTTAPRTAQPIERSAQPSAQVATGAARPGVAQGRGFGSLLMGGLLGAGLFGLLTGAGLFAGLGSLAGILGFLLQLALIAGLAMLAMNFFRSRSSLATAGAGAGSDATRRPGPDFARSGANLAGSAPALAKLNIAGDDFNAFERLLGNIQAAYGRQDRTALRALTSKEMFHYFDDELTANDAKGVVNRIGKVKLLQGDLSEAWSEAGAEYATVAMRYAIDDTIVDAKSGRIVSAGEPEVTEVWTFQRNPGASPLSWKLSAIQQV